MPKTTKRAATKRAARIAKAHATELPKLQVKAPPPKRLPGYKPPARGLARYPWASLFALLLIAGGIYGLYFYHLGPFAPQVAKPKPVAVSPCLKVVDQLTDTSPAPGPATI